MPVPHYFEGACFCCAIRYRVSAAPTIVSHCHCAMCRRISGAALVTWATFELDAFVVTQGTPARLASSERAERTFCRDCGTPLTWQLARNPTSVDVTVCSFDDPDLFAPSDHIWTRSSPRWLHVGDGLPKYPQQRPTR